MSNSTDTTETIGSLPRSPSTVESLIATVIVCTVLSVATFAIFVCLRKRYKRFYMPLCYDPTAKDKPDELLALKDWVLYTYRYPMEKIIETGGVDAFEYLNFLKHSIFLFIAISLINLTVILPINATATSAYENTDHADYVTGLNSLYIGSIDERSPLLWAHLVSVYIYSLLTWYTAYRIYSENIEMNTSLTIKEKHLLKYRTVMIHHLPSIVKSDQSLKEYFSVMYRDKVDHAMLVPYLPVLRTLQNKRKQFLKYFKECIEVFEKEGKRPTHWVGSFFPRKKRYEVDSIAYYEDQICQVNEEIHRELEKPHTETDIGFVSFESIAIAMQCVQTLHSSNSSSVTITKAPVPKDICWEFLVTYKHHYFYRGVLIYGILIMLFIFWSIPVTIISAWTNLHNLSKLEIFNPLIDLVEKSRSISGVVEGFLPTLSLNIFMALLPIILKLIMDHRGFPLFSRLERNLMRVYWLFIFLYVYVMSVSAGTLFDILYHFISNPATIVQRLATSLPTQATFFTNYIMIEFFFTFPFLLARFPDFFIAKFLLLFKKAESARAEAEAPCPFEYYVYYARELLIFNVGLGFSSMSPIITLFAVLYFAVGYWRAKYNYVFVYPPNFNEGIKMTPLAINRIVIGMYIYQVTLLGVFALKYFAPGGTIVILVIATAIFHYSLHKKYLKPYKHLALEDCFSVDEEQEKPKEDLKSYLDPALNAPEEFIPTSNLHANSPIQSHNAIELETRQLIVPLEEDFVNLDVHM